MIDYPVVLAFASDLHRDRLRKAQQARLVRLALAAKEETQNSTAVRRRSSWSAMVATSATKLGRLVGTGRNSRLSPASE